MGFTSESREYSQYGSGKGQKGGKEKGEKKGENSGEPAPEGKQEGFAKLFKHRRSNTAIRTSSLKRRRPQPCCLNTIVFKRRHPNILSQTAAQSWLLNVTASNAIVLYFRPNVESQTPTPDGASQGLPMLLPK